ncbi:STAS domain-containing protein [Gemmata sp. G18]|uniref:STAS domain-containing protein n=1 Tax=Gemmata palustris TaxID=2822762 RepID=A0ABS5C3R2_9BACT|nr:STAS domain-containing protein [Gemmata palustris]MBP3960632.1 STAS domain-containing protein [Gemmata palustris]
MVSDEPIHVTVDPETGTSNLVLKGRITVECARTFHTVARDLVAGTTNVRVSCEGAEFFDVSAIQIFLALGRELMKQRRRCDIVGVTGPLAADFRLVGLGGAPA